MHSSTDATPPASPAPPEDGRRSNDILLRLFGELQDAIGSQRWLLARVRPNDYVAKTFMGLTGRGSSIAAAVTDLIDAVRRFQEDPDSHVHRRDRQGSASDPQER